MPDAARVPPTGAERPRLAFQPVFVLLSAIALFTVFWYFGRKAGYWAFLDGVFPATSLSPLYPFFYFCVMSVVLRMLVPMALVRFVLRRPLRDVGYARVQGGVGVYVGLYLAMVPIVVLASYGASFQSYYPQFREVVVRGEVLWWHFLTFELVYLLLFVSGESFWRGYIVFGLEETLGDYAIPIMVVPYVMSHYEKPFGETMGAFVAGSLLGWLALRHRSFWPGVLVHWGVAVTMDLCALWQNGITIVY